MSKEKIDFQDAMLVLKDEIDYKDYAVLLVDDEEDVLITMSQLFEDDFNIDSTTDANVAVKMLQEKEYAVIVSDQRMPTISGSQLLSLAREVSPATTRILLTGYSDLQATINVINEGEAFRYISKNAPTDEKESHIEEAIQRYVWFKAQEKFEA